MRISAPLALGIVAAAGCGKTPPESLLFPGPRDAALVDVAARDLGPSDGSGPDFGLPPADGGAADGGLLDLGGPLDAGPPPDAGQAPDAGPPPPPLCDLGSLQIGITVRPVGTRDFQGRARVLGLDPLVLQPAGRRDPLILSFTSDTPAPPLEIGRRYDVFLARPTPMTDDVFLAVQSEDATALVYAVWATAVLPEGFLPHERVPCGPDPLGCGELDGLEMVLDSAQGGRLRVRNGERVRLMDYTVVNGRSRAYARGPTCPETPERFYEGALVLEP